MNRFRVASACLMCFGNGLNDSGMLPQSFDSVVLFLTVAAPGALIP